MRVCLLAPRVPPTPCGVGDYTFRLATALAAQGTQVEVLTSRNQQPSRSDDGRLEVRPLLPDWNLGGMRTLISELTGDRRDRVILQWVPSLYEPRGMNPFVPAAMVELARRGQHTVTVVHEAGVPFDRWQHFISGPIQRASLLALAVSSRSLLVSTGPWAAAIRRMVPWDGERVRWVPVGSNIPVVPQAGGRSATRHRLGLDGTSLVLGVFSPLGNAKGLDLIVSAWERAKVVHPQARLAVVGVVREQLDAAIPAFAGDPRVVCPGYLPPEGVSAWLQSMDLLMAPFLDGLSGRRASALAAMEHGVPVVTTRGHLYDAHVFENSPVVVTDYDKLAFGDAVLRLSRAEDERRRLSKLLPAFHEKHFAWHHVADAVLK